MKNLRYYLDKAEKEKFAIPQFNFSDFTQMKAIAEKCAELKSPAILGTSEGESKFFGLQEAVALRDVLRKKLGAAIFLNLDHGKSLDYLKQAGDAGYDMIHFDGSKLPTQENIKITKEVSKYAKKKARLRRQGILLEGEMGKIGTDSSKVYTEKFVINEADLTKPAEALEYVEKTKVNLLAISVGNFHGIEVSGVDPNLRLDILAEIKKVVGKKAMLVLHGGSGTPEDDIKQAIKLGVVKININTELRMAFAGNLRRNLSNNPEEVVPYKFLADAKEAVKNVVERKIKLFGSINKVD